MHVLDHQLRDSSGKVTLDSTPNMGPRISPEYLVIHYTAGRSGQSSVNHFKNAAAKASAHLVIDRSGQVWQLVPFDRAAWHAGASRWDGRNGVNDFSIGIEIDNAGKLQKVGSEYQAWFGARYAESDVIHAVHQHAHEKEYWHAYTEPQLAVLLDIATLLFATYNLRDIVGHDDISPGRKVDPGPAFPLSSVRSRVLGRSENIAPRYRVTADLLNIRTGPGIEFPKAGPPLPAGTTLEVLEARTEWSEVVAIEQRRRGGWVRNSFIARAA